MFSSISSRTPSPSDIDIYIDAATVTIAKGTGFSLVVHDLRMGEHIASDGVIEVGSKGVMLKANIDGDSLKIDDFEIKSAFTQIDFGSKGKGTKTGVILGGQVEWEGREFKAGVHLYQSPEPGKSSFDYTVVGQFKTTLASEPLPLASLVPALEDTFMKDVALQGAALISASRNDAEIGAFEIPDS